MPEHVPWILLILATIPLFSLELGLFLRYIKKMDNDSTYWLIYLGGNFSFFSLLFMLIAWWSTPLFIAIPLLVLPVIVTLIGSFQVGIQITNSLYEHLGLRLFPKHIYNGRIRHIYRRLKKRVGNNPAWHGVIEHVKYLMDLLPQIERTLQDITKRITSVDQTQKALRAEMYNARGNESLPIQEIRRDLDDRRQRLCNLRNSIRLQIGSAQVMSVSLRGGDPVSDLEQQCGRLMTSVREELNLASTTEQELSQPDAQVESLEARRRRASAHQSQMR